MKGLLAGLIGVLVVGSVLAAWAQVFPARWDYVEPQNPAVDPGAVAIGGGGVSLNPNSSYLTDTAGLPGGHLAINGSAPGLPVEERCTAANRGEIRLKVLTGLPYSGDPTGGTTVEVDALCHCAKEVRRSSAVIVEIHYWSCYYTTFS